MSSNLPGHMIILLTILLDIVLRYTIITRYITNITRYITNTVPDIIVNMNNTCEFISLGKGW